MIPSRLRYRLLIASCSLLTVVSMVSIMDAVAAPTLPPTGGNTSIILSTGSAAQTKSGPLTINSTLSLNTLTTSGTISAASICLSNGCRNSWPSPNNSTPNLATVMGNGNTAYHNLIGNSLYGMALNGTMRYNWPTAYYNGRTSPNAYYYAPNFCPHGVPPNAPDCYQAFSCGAGYICGANTDFWGNLRSFACCSPSISSY